MAESKETIIIELKIDDGKAGKALPQAKQEIEALATSMLGLQQANKKLREERRLLDTTTEEGTKRIQELNDIIEKNDEILKRNSTSLEKQRLNVGNYKRGVTDALKEVRIGGINVGDVVDKLSKANEDLFQGMIKGYKESAIGAKLFGNAARTALTLTGIGILIAGLATIVAYWDDIKVAIGLADSESEAYFKKQKANAEIANEYLRQIVKQHEFEVELLRAKGAAQDVLLEKQLDAAKVEKEIAENSLRPVREEYQRLLIEMDNLSQASDNSSESMRKMSEGSLNELKEQVKETKKNYDSLKDAVVDADNKIKVLGATISKNDIDQAKKTSDERNKILEKEINDKAKLLNEQYKETLSEEQRLNEQIAELNAADGDNFQEQHDKMIEALNENARKRLEIEMELKNAVGELRIQDLTEYQQYILNKNEIDAQEREVVAESMNQFYEAGKMLLEANVNDQIKKVKDGEQKKLKAIEERLRNGTISEAQATAQRDKVQKESEEKQNEIKKKAFETNKKIQIAETLISTAQAAIAAYRSLVGIPYIGPVLAAVAAAAASAFGLAKVNLIRSQQFAMGGLVAAAKFAIGGRADKRGTFDGPSHAGGGIDYIRSDGKHRINVEGGENFYVLKKSASMEINRLSALNQKHGGVSWEPSGTYPSIRYASGGQVIASQSPQDTGNIERTVRAVMATMPPIYVVAQDVSQVLDTDSEIKQRAQVI